MATKQGLDPDDPGKAMENFILDNYVILTHRLEVEKGCFVINLRFLQSCDVDDFYHDHFRVGPGSLSAALSDILITDEMRAVVGGKELMVRLEVRYDDYIRVRRRLCSTGLQTSASVDNLAAILPPPKETASHPLLNSLDLATTSTQDSSFTHWVTDPCTKQLVRKMRKTSQALTGLETKHEIVKHQMESQRHELQRLRREGTVLTQEKETAGKVLLEHKKEIADLTEVNKGMTESIKVLNAEKTELTDRLAGVTVQGEHEEAQHLVELQEDMVTSLHRKVTQLTREQETAQKLLLDNKKEIEDLAGANKGMEDTIDELVAEKTKLTNRLTMMEEQRSPRPHAEGKAMASASFTTGSSPKIGSKRTLISLSLPRNYAPDWDVWEGMREMVQNWHDGILKVYDQDLITFDRENLKYTLMKDTSAVVEYQVTAKDWDSKTTTLGWLHYSKVDNRLTLINRNIGLHKKCLMLGYSKKPRCRDVIGQFGEGMKIGALALLRRGRLVTIETSEDRWKFELQEDENFGEEVLTVVVSGTLLLDKDLQGQLYVKGVWIQDLRQDLKAGVNFCQWEIDRDRHAVPHPSDITHHVSCMWVRALERRPDLAGHYYKLVEEDECRDVEYASLYNNQSTAILMADQFAKRHGDSSFPVVNTMAPEELQKVKDELNRNIVSCNKTLYEILQKSGRYVSVEEALAGSQVTVNPDLSPHHTPRVQKHASDRHPGFSLGQERPRVPLALTAGGINTAATPREVPDKYADYQTDTHTRHEEKDNLCTRIHGGNDLEQLMEQDMRP
ncbi:hypothetical protein Bbelb_157470 [Branchiostoma belcheri]|nr:hypothetical protein Bbelb_157470 [Branchiostoma belcheri]